MENKIGKKWTQEEDNQLLRLYNEENLDIIDIAKQHNRLPRAIAVRLVKHEVISNEFEAKGYTEYKNSDYYKEMMEKNYIKKEKQTKTLQENNNILITINKNDYLQLQQDITEIKQDITQMKENILTINSNMKELIDMIKSIYEFEDA